MEPVPNVAVILRTMLLDAAAAQATGLLAEHAIPAILMKGRVTASWLYADGERRYRDVDLLVDPALRDRAVEVLGTIGYTHRLAGADQVEYSTTEVDLVGTNGVCIDLHHTLLGLTASPQRCWHVLSHRTEQMSVGGATVTVFDPVARTMHLALHVAQNGPVDTKAVADLQQGLAQLPLAMWHQAAHLARSMDGIEAFSSGLLAVEQGRCLAAEMALAPPRDVGLVLRGWSVPQQALQIQNFLDAGSMRLRLRLVARKIWPTAASMSSRVPGARGDGRVLLAARVSRMARLPGVLGLALWNWNRARREVRLQGTVRS